MKFYEIYTRLCRSAGKIEILRDIQEVPEELQKNLEFSELEITGNEVVALSALTTIISFVGLLPTTILSLITDISLFVPLILLPIPALLYLLIGWYPGWRADKKRRKIAGGIPRLVSHLTVSLKITPNLESAAKFAAKRSEDKIKEGFRNEIWKAVMRNHSSYERALTKFGDFWKEKCRELKKSIDLIKSSVNERDEKTRKKILDQALETSFEGVRKEMDKFISNLKLPTTLIYGVGILLPLILIAVLPVISSIGMRISGFQLGVVYCILLPSSVFVLEKHSLSKRPAALDPPEISADRLGKKAAALPAAGVIPLTAFVLQLPQEIKILTIIWGLGIGISLYCYFSSAEPLRTRSKNIKLKEELPETLTILGNQLKGGKPAEKSFKKTSRNAQGSEIASILKKAAANMKIGGMGTRSALFDPDEGALKEIRSTPVRSTFRILTDLLKRNARSAGRALLDKAKHLREIREAKREMRNSLQDITNSMKSVAFFFAPLVASVTAQLQRVLSSRTTEIPILGSGSKIDPSIFLGILGFYLLALTILISIYIVEIERGNDDLYKRKVIAKAIPTTLSVFTIGVYAGRRMLSFLL